MNSDRERRDSRDIRLQRRAAPTHAAHAAVARSCMMMSVNPPTLALGRSAKRALHQASREQRDRAATHRRPGARSAERAHAIGSALCPRRKKGAQRPRGAQRGARSARRRSGSLHAPWRAERPRHRSRERAAQRAAARRGALAEPRRAAVPHCALCRASAVRLDTPRRHDWEAIAC